MPKEKKQEARTKTVELAVGLKIPDVTAITALQTLKRIGLAKIVDVHREDYYRFSITGEPYKFRNEIVKADVLINANKNNFKYKLEKKQNTYSEAMIAVSNIGDNCSGLLTTLNAAGFKDIKKIERKVVWSLAIDAKSNDEAVSIAEKAAQILLVNKNYQEYKVMQL